ncbi:MAG: hypothetical protein ACYCSN_14500 [Acidobacteriaceae bacterium]
MSRPQLPMTRVYGPAPVLTGPDQTGVLLEPYQRDIAGEGPLKQEFWPHAILGFQQQYVLVREIVGADPAKRGQPAMPLGPASNYPAYNQMQLARAVSGPVATQMLRAANSNGLIGGVF